MLASHLVYNHSFQLWYTIIPLHIYVYIQTHTHTVILNINEKSIILFNMFVSFVYNMLYLLQIFHSHWCIIFHCVATQKFITDEPVDSFQSGASHWFCHWILGCFWFISKQYCKGIFFQCLLAHTHKCFSWVATGPKKMIHLDHEWRENNTIRKFSFYLFPVHNGIYSFLSFHPHHIMT